ncbi:MAG TPA: MinD/ParA family protein [Microbacterium sp.]|nr:MinD/ParA family protein [Microbacterium sp.]HKT58390.1 MinD/ParA family protein [Microbacterium sp.]
MTVTPERPDERVDDAEDNGVLPDAVGVDTTSIDFLGGATAQVNVVVPGAAADDDDDDDIFGDEVEMAAFLDDDEDEPDDEAAEQPGDEPAPAADDEDIEDAVVIEDDEPDEEPDAGEAFAAPASGIHSAPAESDVQDEVDAWQVSEAAGPEPLEPVGTEPDAPAAAEPVAEDDAEEAFEADPALPVIDEAFAFIDHPATTEFTAVPATRREANQTVPVARPRDTERPAAARTVAPELASKRFGEFESDRESADLLTADRLLDQHRLARPEPEGGWSRVVYSLTGGRLNLGDGKRAKARKELDRRIAAPLTGGARFVPVLSRKGGVGKTTVTTLLGMALADARDDRVIAIDANPDRGTLADRIARPSGHTVRDLVRTHDAVTGYNDISTIVTRDRTRLDVLASDTDPRVSEAFNDRDYEEVARVAAHYYSIVLTDTGTGIVHSVMGATLDTADQLVIVSGLSIDEARLASETLTWLETNGFRDRVRGAIVVLNNSRPGSPLVRAGELEAHFGTRVRRVVQMPYDAQIATGSAIVFRELQPATRDAARALAEAVVAGLRGESGAS